MIIRGRLCAPRLFRRQVTECLFNLRLVLLPQAVSLNDQGRRPTEQLQRDRAIPIMDESYDSRMGVDMICICSHCGDMAGKHDTENVPKPERTFSVYYAQPYKSRH